MTLEALTMEILKKLMAQDTVNPPGNERRGAVCLKEIFDRRGSTARFRILEKTGRTSSRR